MMHKRLEEIKNMLRVKEYEKADEALKEYRKIFPDDWNGKLMEGLIAELRGDVDTFWNIISDAEQMIDTAYQIQKSPLWDVCQSIIDYPGYDFEWREVRDDQSWLKDDHHKYDKRRNTKNVDSILIRYDDETTASPYDDEMDNETIVENVGIRELYAAPNYLAKRGKKHDDDTDDVTDNDTAIEIIPDFDGEPSEYTNPRYGYGSFDDDIPSEDFEAQKKAIEDAKKLHNSPFHKIKRSLNKFFCQLFDYKSRNR